MVGGGTPFQKKTKTKKNNVVRESVSGQCHVA